MAVEDIDRKFKLSDLASGEFLFAVIGVTDGNLLAGVRFAKRAVTTHTVVMRPSSGTVRWIKAEHQRLDRFVVAVGAKWAGRRR